MTPKLAQNYGLKRDGSESIRLEAQHLLTRLHNGHAINPRIPISSGMRIAEVATGTGAWLFDLAQELPSDVVLHGYDISDEQFPNPKLWPSNVQLEVMDAFLDPPDSVLGTYDVVHVRYLAITVARGRDLNVVIQHALNLLKPGGYLQWEEGNLSSHEVRGSVAKDFDGKIDKLLKDTGTDFGWVFGLESALERNNLEIIEYSDRRFKPGLIHMCTNTYLLALRDILDGIKSDAEWHDHELIPDCYALLNEMIVSQNNGLVFNWCPVSVLAQKPGSA